VNLLVKEAIEGRPTLFTGHLSRLVGGLERGLLHRSVTHYRSALSCSKAHPGHRLLSL